MNKKRILGTVQLGLAYGVNNGIMPDRSQSLELLEFAYDQGVRDLDTASVYGQSLDVIGDYHSKYPEKKFQVYSKFMINDLTNDLNGLINSQCKKLNVKNLEGLYFHRFNEYKSHRHLLENNFSYTRLGVSIYTLDELKEVLQDELVNIIQVSFSIFHHNSEIQNFLRGLKTSKKIYVRSIYLQGLLFLPLEKLTGALAQFIPILNFIDQLSKDLSLSKKEIAAQYVMDQASIAGVLFGAETKLQVEENWQLLRESNLDWNDILKNMPKLKDENLLNPSNWK